MLPCNTYIVILLHIFKFLCIRDAEIAPLVRSEQLHRTKMIMEDRRGEVKKSSYFREPGLLIMVPVIHGPVLGVNIGERVRAILSSLVVEFLHPQLLHKLFVRILSTTHLQQK